MIKSRSRTNPGSDSRPSTGLDHDVLAVLQLLTNIQRATDRQLKTLCREKELSERALLILALVNRGHDRPARLRQILDVLPSTISVETEKLVIGGLITREPIAGDRRKVRLALTPEGRTVNFEASDLLNALLKPRLAALEPGQLDAFLSIGDAITPPDD